MSFDVQDNSRGLIIVLVITMAVLFWLSLMIGSESLSLLQALNDLRSGEDSLAAVVLLQIRLPRAAIALVVGASLGLCGAAMQGLLRNPLASPGLIGSASGAALFAILVLYFGLADAGFFVLPVAGMTGALLATALVYALAGRDASVTTLILAGVAINALATACMSLLLNLAPSPYAVRELVLWTLGEINDRSLGDLALMLPTTLAGWLLLVGVGRQLDVLTLGERTAYSMGLQPVRLRWRVFIAVSLAVGAAVATVGMIGFIGLVVPHLLRPFVGFQPGRLLPVSALGGACMLLAADICVRLIPTETDLKIGVLTALVGAPFFLHLIVRSRREYI
ncbi:MAG: iron ABC transporter permease [Gammaproteobacteria bacterium]|nr:iron ABC transporter permease [Gammaproteobacteria bacterium]